jgi:hypothetical protein
MPSLRKLNERGLAELTAFLGEVTTDSSRPVPAHILTDLETSEELTATIEVEQRNFASRMQAGEYLHGIFSKPEAGGLDRDPGIWAWLSLFYFDQLCPRQKDGTRKPGELARWIPSGHAFRYYRHLLGGPYLIYRSYREAPEKARIILCGQLEKPGDFVEQLASRQDLVQNKSVIEAATLLYYDEEKGRPKRGSQSTEHKPGTLRRFVDLVMQLDKTWDLFSMTGRQLLDRLPQEFDNYRPAEASA